MSGVVDYANYEDMKRAVSCLILYVVDMLISMYLFLWINRPFPLMQIRKLDDSEFRNAFSRAFIRVYL